MSSAAISQSCETFMNTIENIERDAMLLPYRNACKSFVNKTHGP